VKAKPLAVLDSNVIFHSVVTDHPNRAYHEKCRVLLERGLGCELDHILSLNPVVVVEVFSALRRLLNLDEAEFRTDSLASAFETHRFSASLEGGFAEFCSLGKGERGSRK